MRLTKVQVIQDLINLQEQLYKEVGFVINSKTEITGLLTVHKGIGDLIGKLETSRAGGDE